MFDWMMYVREALRSPQVTDNDAAYTAKVNRTAAQGLVARCIGIHLLEPGENTFDHHVLMALVDQRGNVINGARADWGWYGMKADEHPSPVIMDKMLPEPPGNLPLWKTFQSVWVSILEAPGVALAGSDVVYDLTTWFVYGEPADAGHLYHRSFLVVWQVMDQDGEMIEEPVEMPIEGPAPDPVDVSQILRDAGSLYLGLEEMRHELLANIIEPLEAINGTK
jgi:hypothetical protein